MYLKPNTKCTLIFWCFEDSLHLLFSRLSIASQSLFSLYLQQLSHSMEQFWHDQELIQIYNQQILAQCQHQKQEQPSKMHSVHSMLEVGTKESSRNEKKRLAGQKSRQKKKNYIKTLQENVKQLTEEIQNFDLKISTCKDTLVQALKTSNSHSNQHTYTFAQLQRNALSQDPDLDRINLLIDLIRNRIGANGKERQSNINYNFKQIVNSMFPAIYRYLFNTAEQSTDLFAENASSQSLIADTQNSWTHELFINTKIQDEQLQKLRKEKGSLVEKRSEAVGHMKRLNEAKEQVKRQGQFFQKKLASIRQALDPIQCALMTVFAQKNKLRREFTFCTDFQNSERRPRKIIKDQ